MNKTIEALERARENIVNSRSAYYEERLGVNLVVCVSVEDINSWFDSEIEKAKEAKSITTSLFIPN